MSRAAVRGSRGVCGARYPGRAVNFQEILANLLVPGVNVVEKVVRPLVVYAFLILILRVGGRRELGQMNAFDLVVLLTLSNTVQNAIIGNDTSLVGGMIGGATLVGANVAVVRFLYRHPRLDRAIEGKPTLLVHNGRAIPQQLERELITQQELLAAVRRQGVSSIAECEQVILETTGTLTVLLKRPTAEEQSVSDLATRLARIEELLSSRPAPGPEGERPA